MQVAQAAAAGKEKRAKCDTKPSQWQWPSSREVLFVQKNKSQHLMILQFVCICKRCHDKPKAENMPGKVMTSNFAISEPAVIFNLWNKIKSKNEHILSRVNVSAFAKESPFVTADK